MTGPDERPRFLDELGYELARLERERARSGRAGPRTPRLRTVLLTGAGVLALAGGAGAATGIVPLSGDGPAFVAPDRTAAFSAELTDRVQALGRTRVPGDAMGAAGRHVAGPDAPAPGSSLRIVAPAPPDVPGVAATRSPAWVLPTSAGAASLQVLPEGATGPASGATADVAMLEAGRAWMTVGDELFGLAPDGVTAVGVRLADDRVVTLPVQDNVFGASILGQVQEVKIR